MPQEASEWVAAFSDLAVECLDGESVRAAAIIGRAGELFRSWPGDGRLAFTDLPSDDIICRLLDCKAHESASIRLLGSKLGWIISRSADGNSIVTVSAPGVDEVTFEAISPALGLIAAAATLVAKRLDAPGGSATRPHALH